MADRAPALFTIPSTESFVDALAAGVLAQVGDEPAALSQVVILLPNRRSCRAMSEAFLRRADGRPLLLPRLTPLGDVDEDDLALADTDGENSAWDLEVPPAISRLRRQLLLTNLVRRAPRGLSALDQAARLASELARFLDQVHTERLSFAGLAELVDEDFAEHWRITLDFLAIVTDAWPEVLVEAGCLDPADRRNRLLAARAAAWRAQPPATPVIAAGSTGSVPATADLLGVVARLPQGAVVLPGLDTWADERTWAAVGRDPCHPQFAMAQLLDRLGTDRRAVKDWPASTMAAQCGGQKTAASQRAALIRRAMVPAECADAWRADTERCDQALEGLAVIEAPGPEEEARAIALILREALETPERTAALVTPDRALARRVACEMQRWNVHVDDSAGQPLKETVPGTFLRLAAAAVAEELAPVPLLALLKHPLAACGLAPDALRRWARGLEEKVLRGPRPGPGIDGLRAALAAGGTDQDSKLARLDRIIGPFQRLLASRTAPFVDLLRAHVQMAEAMAASDREAGQERLWAGDAGEALAAFLAELDAAAQDFGPVEAGLYPALLDELMADSVVRPRFGRHPRLFIWGPLEARLQRADVMILGSLNEDTWPPAARTSPWMSRPMMAKFGLPPPERRIGLSAHDFVQGTAGETVWLTRSRRNEGQPTVASRWLVRLENLLDGTDAGSALVRCAGRWLHWQRALDEPEKFVPVEPPRPKPPVEARPRRLSATQVETWMRDPYAIFARHVLGLKALDSLDADPSAADYGAVIHHALDLFVGENPGILPADALDRLLDAGRRSFGSILDRPGIHAFWWPRFERIARWFVEVEGERRAGLRASKSEVKGALIFDAPAGPFELTAIADRIDTLADGSLVVIDYKTGEPPHRKEIVAGFAPQLPLEAAIAEAGGFPGVAHARVSSLEYWALKGGKPAGKRITVADNIETVTRQALDGLRGLVARFDLVDTPYESRPRPEVAPKFSDYEHLARIKEWSAGGDSGE
jgi:ATP-dependent helicase/nuclease subunit B